jgi:putative peptidoglycan lipid II flippase
VSLLRSGIVVALFTFLSRISGFARDMLMSATLGAGLLTDIFNIAFRIPNFFRRIFAEGAFNSAFLPIFSAKLTSDGKVEAHNFANQVFTILSLVLLLVVSLMEIAMPLVISLLAPGYTNQPSHLELAAYLTRITMPYLLFISLVSLMSGILNSLGKFAIAAATPILLNISMIGALLYLPEYTETKAHALAWGVFIAGLAQLIFITIAVRNSNMLPKIQKPSLTPDLKKLFKNMIPGIIASGVVQINMAIDLAIVTFLPIGSLSLLMYAERISYLPLALIGTAIGTVLLPTLSKQIKENRLEESYYTQNRSIEIAMFLSLPCSFALATIAHPISYMLYERGEFTSLNTTGVATALAAFGAGLPAFILIKIFTSTFFATQDTKTPVKISVISVAINIVLNLVLMQFLQHTGIALATSISAWVNILFLFIILKRKKLLKLDQRLKEKLPRIIISSIGMTFVLHIILKSMHNKIYVSDNHTMQVIAFSLTIIAGGISYLGIAYLLKIIDIKELRSAILRK